MYNGRALTEEEITGLLIAVLFAGQHTSSITTAWTGLFMSANKVRSARGLDAAPLFGRRGAQVPALSHAVSCPAAPWPELQHPWCRLSHPPLGAF